MQPALWGQGLQQRSGSGTAWETGEKRLVRAAETGPSSSAAASNGNLPGDAGDRRETVQAIYPQTERKGVT